jgi:superfamily II DNA/RNA helicase
MNGLSDYKALTQFFKKPVTLALDIKQTMIFVDNRARTQDICKFIRSMLAPELRDVVAFLHSLKGARSKQKVMEEFLNGRVHILVATESAGKVHDTQLPWAHRS